MCGTWKTVGWNHLAVEKPYIKVLQNKRNGSNMTLKLEMSNKLKIWQLCPL
jgi:hypothetical protein